MTQTCTWHFEFKKDSDNYSFTGMEPSIKLAALHEHIFVWRKNEAKLHIIFYQKFYYSRDLCTN